MKTEEVARDVNKMPIKIRVSLASAILLGLTDGFMDAKPTTIYLLTYRDGKCTANCSFCSQARESTSRANMLSRVIWPVFPTREVIEYIKKMEKNVQRICIQAMNYPDVFKDVIELVRRIHAEVNIPISISCQPLTPEQMRKLKEENVDKIGIPLDAATEKLFEEAKGSSVGGPYLWEKSLEALRNAVQIFGRGRVSTHFIVGLGENDEELISMIQRVVDLGVYPALFAFTPLNGTRLEGKAQPEVERYRCIQLAQFLITSGKAAIKDILFDEEGHIRGYNINEDIVRETAIMGVPFLTSGCPGCNRPYYNERAGGPLYNYPRSMSSEEIVEVNEGIRRYLHG